MFHRWRSFRPSFLAEKRCAETIGEHMPAVIPRSQSTAEPSDTERQCWRSLWSDLQAVGKPLLLGLGLLAAGAGAGTYALIMTVWRLKGPLAWKRRDRRNADVG